MKIKFLSIAFALVVAVLFTACSKGPSGDPKADAKQCAQEMVDLMKKDLKTLDDVKSLETEVEALQKKYEDFYKEKGEDQLKEFQKAVEDLENDPEIKKQVEDAQKVMMENVTKLMGEESKSE
ncbi:MAG: hypothetical protein J5629_03165 [Muribaculaceae bacterium]|nr:hypothetical protein [Muribaculaceae bacterium]